MPVIPHIDGPETFSAAFHVSRETVGNLDTYAALLRNWQRTINLVAPSTLDDLWHRHMADSAQLVALAEKWGQPPFPGSTSGPGQAGDGKSGCPHFSWLDLGSGAGFPGLVVAILLAERRPGSRVTLIESDQRKAAFLREVARQTGAPVDILSIRIEKCATQFTLPQPDIVSARALAPLSRLLELAVPFLTPRTIGLFLKGKEAAREVEDARRGWRFDAELVASRTDAEARVVVVRNVEANVEG